MRLPELNKNKNKFDPVVYIHKKIIYNIFMIVNAGTFWDEHHSELIIDLDGPEGNAFFLLAKVKSFGRQLGLSKDEQKTISEEMRSGNYKHLLEVFDKHFGDYVTMVTSDDHLIPDKEI